MDGLTSTDLILNGINNIFKGDKSKLDKTLGGQGWRYFAAGLCIFPLTLIKVAVFLYDNRHLFYVPKTHITPVEEVNGIGLSMPALKRSSDFVYLREIKCFNDRAWKSMDETLPKTTTKESTLLRLQDLFNHNLYLKGDVLRITRNRVKDKDLIKSAETGELTAPFITQRVSFGDDINKMLKVAVPTLKLRKTKGSDNTYIVFENDEIFELEQKLRSLFMLPITITTKKKEA